MVKKSSLTVVIALYLAVAIAFILSWPVTPRGHANLQDTSLPDLENGERIFYLTGCKSCHQDPLNSSSMVLTGGISFNTEFGTFYAPNISTSVENGIGAWNFREFENAVRHGVSPDGKHYFPSFPYTAYKNIKDKDLFDLYQFIKTLEPSETASKPHKLHFPFNKRILVGIWKHLFFYHDNNLLYPNNHGSYLVETLGHCAECHTPRKILGGLDKKKWLSGAKAIKNESAAPNITPHKTGLLEWTEDDIVNYLETGFTPDFDSAGGKMVDVLENLSKAPKADLQAIAKYLSSIEPLSNN